MLMDRESLIKTYMPVASRLARQLAPRYLRDEAISVGYIALIEAVDKRHKARELGPYLYCYVRTSLLDYLRKLPPKTEPLDDITSGEDDTAGVIEVLTRCCRTTLERRVLNMRMQYMSLRSIERTLGCSYHHVQTALQRVHHRCLYRLYGKVYNKKHR